MTAGVWATLIVLWAGAIALAVLFVGVGSSDLRTMRKAERGRQALGRVIPTNHGDHHHADHP